MKFFRQFVSAAVAILSTLITAETIAAPNPFVGEWALVIPGGHAGWLGVEQKGDQLTASILWGWGSVTPVDEVRMDKSNLVLTRKHNVEVKDATGKKTKKVLVETITASASGDALALVSLKDKESGDGQDRATFAGRRQPPMPPAPDLSKVKWGAPVKLFNGTSLDGWRLTDPGAVNGWSVKNGLLVNNPVQEDGKPHKNYGNLRTDREFEDFKVTVEVRLPENGNSGLYLRGIYEVQVAESFGKPPSAHGMGGLYSRIQPTANPSRKPGEWQTLEATLVDRHVTVALNGQKIIDNQPVLGCTGGALWSDVSRPGPIYLQGDHTAVEYRSIVIEPAVR